MALKSPLEEAVDSNYGAPVPTAQPDTSLVVGLTAEELEDAKKNATFMTYTGRMFNAFDPQPEDVDIRDIAHALSQTCRYGGMCSAYYSVAQHSGYVSRQVKDEDDWKLWGLLHDAAEAYIGDMPKPFKPFMLNFDYVEGVILKVIADKFGLDWYENQHQDGVPDVVSKVDEMMLYTEARQLLPGCTWAKKDRMRPTTEGYADFLIQPMSPDQAEQAFLHEFSRLYFRR